MLLTAKKWVVFSVGLVLFVVTARDGLAATAVWTGGTSSDYFDATNWLGSAPPAAGDAVRVGDTANAIANFPIYTGDNSATPIGSNAPVTFNMGFGQTSTFTVQPDSTLVSNGPVLVGTGAFTSTWTQNGGAVTINGTSENNTQGMRIGTDVSGAIGQMVMNGGTIRVNGARLTTAQSNGTKAVITMSGGEIRANAIRLGSDIGSTGNSITTLNLTGGTIKSDKEINIGSSNGSAPTALAGYVNATINNGGILWATTVGTNSNQASTIRFQGGHINLGIGGTIRGGDMSGRDGFNYNPRGFDYAALGLPNPGLDFQGGVLEFYGDNFNLEGNSNMGASCAVSAASNNPACYFAVPSGVDPTDPSTYKTFNNRDSLRMLAAIEQGPADSPFRFYTTLPDHIVKVVDAPDATPTTPARAFATIKGDYNGNGVVDAADYVVWREFNGYTYLYEATDATSVIPYFGADGNGDGIVDQNDYDVWRANFGKTATGGPFAFGAGAGSGLAAGSSAVPEPASALIMLVGCVVASFATSRCRKS